jgi:hypothetical protein
LIHINCVSVVEEHGHQAHREHTRNRVRTAADWAAPDVKKPRDGHARL